jgi:hypothetical protein
VKIEHSYLLEQNKSLHLGGKELKQNDVVQFVHSNLLSLMEVMGAKLEQSTEFCALKSVPFPPKIGSASGQVIPTYRGGEKLNPA